MSGNKNSITRKERWTVYCPVPLQEFAKAKAKQLKLRGGVSELIQRLIVAEHKSKRGIAERNDRMISEASV